MVFHSFPKITVVATPNLFLNPFFFSVRLPVAILVATANDFTRDARESSHLIRYETWCGFSLCFISSFFLFVYYCLYMHVYIFVSWNNCLWIVLLICYIYV